MEQLFVVYRASPLSVLDEVKDIPFLMRKTLADDKISLAGLLPDGTCLEGMSSSGAQQNRQNLISTCQHYNVPLKERHSSLEVLYFESLLHDVRHTQENHQWQFHILTFSCDFVVKYGRFPAVQEPARTAFHNHLLPPQQVPKQIGHLDFQVAPSAVQPPAWPQAYPRQKANPHRTVHKKLASQGDPHTLAVGCKGTSLQQIKQEEENSVLPSLGLSNMPPLPPPPPPAACTESNVLPGQQRIQGQTASDDPRQENFDNAASAPCLEQALKHRPSNSKPVGPGEQPVANLGEPSLDTGGRRKHKKTSETVAIENGQPSTKTSKKAKATPGLAPAANVDAAGCAFEPVKRAKKGIEHAKRPVEAASPDSEEPLLGKKKRKKRSKEPALKSGQAVEATYKKAKNAKAMPESVPRPAANPEAARFADEPAAGQPGARAVEPPLHIVSKKKRKDKSVPPESGHPTKKSSKKTKKAKATADTEPSLAANPKAADQHVKHTEEPGEDGEEPPLGPSGKKKRKKKSQIMPTESGQLDSKIRKGKKPKTAISKADMLPSMPAINSSAANSADQVDPSQAKLAVLTPFTKKRESLLQKISRAKLELKAAKEKGRDARRAARQQESTRMIHLQGTLRLRKLENALLRNKITSKQAAIQSFRERFEKVRAIFEFA